LAQQLEEKEALELGLNTYLPEGMLQEEIYELINTIVDNTGVDLISMTFSDIADYTNLRKVLMLGDNIDGKRLTMSMTGERGQLQQFIAGLEGSYRPINITRMSEFFVDDAETPDQYRLELQAEAYFWQVDAGGDE